MTSVVSPVQVGSDPSWRESSAFRGWINAITRKINTPTATTQGDIWRTHNISYYALGASGVPIALGFPATAGSANVSPAAGSSFGGMGYVRFDSAAGAGSRTILSLSTIASFWLGDAAGRGGYRIEMYVSPVTATATPRFACGLFNAAPNIAAVDPSTLLNCIFLGCDAADTNMQLMTNDGVGTCTKVNLGASFPVTSGSAYKLVLTAAQNASTVSWTVDRVDTSATQAAGTISTDMPSATTFLGVHLTIGNGSTAAAAQLGVGHVLAEQGWNL